MANSAGARRPCFFVDNSVKEYIAFHTEFALTFQPPSYLEFESIEMTNEDISDEPPREGDVNYDGCVDDADLLAVPFAFGSSGEGLPEDVNRDGVVDDADLLVVLFNFGNGC